MLPFGVTFYPDQWPPETWEENFRRIKEAGFNCVRFGEMAWDWFEPKRGRFNFKPLDQALKLCQKHGLKVLLGIPTSQAPTWMIRRHPKLRPVAHDGTLYPEYGPRPNVCRDNPIYRKYALRLTSHLAKRYRKHAALWLWQIDNEPVYAPLDATASKDYCHCEATRKAFISWAKKKYKTLENLNEKWGAKFWTASFSDWKDIATPKAGFWDAVSPHIFLDWSRFKSESLAEWLSLLKKTVQKYDKARKIGTNGFIGVPSRSHDHDVLAREMDWYGIDIYPKGGSMNKTILAMFTDLWRSFCRGELHVTELQGGQNVRWGNSGYVDGKEFKKWVEILIKHGAQAILFHAWRPALFGSETSGFGILKSDGSPTKRLEAIKQIAKSLKPRRLVAGSPIAIAYLRSSEVETYQEQGPPRGISGQWEPVRVDIGLAYALDSLAGAYQLAHQKYKVVDFIFERHLNEGKLLYKVILMPNPYLLSLQQFNHLTNFVKKGGTLITEARFGLKDEMGHLYPNPLIEKLLGVTYDHPEIKENGFHDVIKGMRPHSIKEKKIGKGKVIYANFSLFLEIRSGKRKWLRLVKGPHPGSSLF